MRNRTIIFTASLSAVTCFWFLPRIQALNPPPDGCYPNFTTAEGCNALNSLTTGAGNTGIGSYSLYLNTSGNSNTAVGAAALALNIADSNTAVGATALLLNTDGKVGTVPIDANGNRVTFKPQAMLEESLKQQKRIAKLEGTVARLAAMVKEQAEQIQKVSAQLQIRKDAPRLTANNQ